MAKKLTRRGLKGLIAFAVLVLLMAVYAVWGEAIADALEAYTGIGYSKFGRIFREPKNGIQVHVIDVGQADCILIRSAEVNILIDAGTNGSEAELSAYLDACRIGTLDYFICTHPHDDHIGGADMIIGEYEVKCLLTNGAFVDSTAYERMNESIKKHSVNTVLPCPGDEYIIGDMTLKVLAASRYADNLNDTSIAVKLTYGETSFLFTGDMEASGERMLLDTYSTAELDCDFYKVAHHGAETSSSMEFLSAVTPDIAAISVGKLNGNGHPRGEVLERLQAVGCETVLRTDEAGTCVIYSDGKEITVIS